MTGPRPDRDPLAELEAELGLTPPPRRPRPFAEVGAELGRVPQFGTAPQPTPDPRLARRDGLASTLRKFKGAGLLGDVASMAAGPLSELATDPLNALEGADKAYHHSARRTVETKLNTGASLLGDVDLLPDPVQGALRRVAQRGRQRLAEGDAALAPYAQLAPTMTLGGAVAGGLAGEAAQYAAGAGVASTLAKGAGAGPFLSRIAGTGAAAGLDAVNAVDPETSTATFLGELGWDRAKRASETLGGRLALDVGLGAAPDIGIEAFRGAREVARAARMGTDLGNAMDDGLREALGGGQIDDAAEGITVPVVDESRSLFSRRESTTRPVRGLDARSDRGQGVAETLGESWDARRADPQFQRRVQGSTRMSLLREGLRESELDPDMVAAYRAETEQRSPFNPQRAAEARDAERARMAALPEQQAMDAELAEARATFLPDEQRAARAADVQQQQRLADVDAREQQAIAARTLNPGDPVDAAVLRHLDSQGIDPASLPEEAIEGYRQDAAYRVFRSPRTRPEATRAQLPQPTAPTRVPQPGEVPAWTGAQPRPPQPPVAPVVSGTGARRRVARGRVGAIAPEGATLRDLDDPDGVAERYLNIEYASASDPRLAGDRIALLQPEQMEEVSLGTAQHIVEPILAPYRAAGTQVEVRDGMGQWFSEDVEDVQPGVMLAFAADTPDDVIDAVAAQMSTVMKQAGYFFARPQRGATLADPQAGRWALGITLGAEPDDAAYKAFMSQVAREARAAGDKFNGTTRVARNQVQIVMNAGATREDARAAYARIERLAQDAGLNPQAKLYEAHAREVGAAEYPNRVRDGRGLSRFGDAGFRSSLERVHESVASVIDNRAAGAAAVRQYDPRSTGRPFDLTPVGAANRYADGAIVAGPTHSEANGRRVAQGLEQASGVRGWRWRTPDGREVFHTMPETDALVDEYLGNQPAMRLARQRADSRGALLTSEDIAWGEAEHRRLQQQGASADPQGAPAGPTPEQLRAQAERRAADARSAARDSLWFSGAAPLSRDGRVAPAVIRRDRSAAPDQQWQVATPEGLRAFGAMDEAIQHAEQQGYTLGKPAPAGSASTEAVQGVAGAGVGALAGAAMDDENRGRGALLGAAIGGVGMVRGGAPGLSTKNVDLSDAADAWGAGGEHFTRAERALRDTPQGKGTVAAWMAVLRKTPGTTPDELREIETLLTTATEMHGRPTITKQEALELVRPNGFGQRLVTESKRATPAPPVDPDLRAEYDDLTRQYEQHRQIEREYSTRMSDGEAEMNTVLAETAQALGMPIPTRYLISDVADWIFQHATEFAKRFGLVGEDGLLVAGPRGAIDAHDMRLLIDAALGEQDVEQGVARALRTGALEGTPAERAANIAEATRLLFPDALRDELARNPRFVQDGVLAAVEGRTRLNAATLARRQFDNRRLDLGAVVNRRGDPGDTAFSSYQRVDAGAEYFESLTRFDGANLSDKTVPNYHWNERDVIGHARGEMHTTAAGERTRHVIEVQSDQGAAASKYGVEGPEQVAKREALVARKSELADESDMLMDALDEAGVSQRTYAAQRDQLQGDIAVAQWKHAQSGGNDASAIARLPEMERELADVQARLAEATETLDVLREQQMAVNTEYAEVTSALMESAGEGIPAHPFVEPKRWVYAVAANELLQAARQGVDWLTWTSVPSALTRTGMSPKKAAIIYEQSFPDAIKKALREAGVKQPEVVSNVTLRGKAADHGPQFGVRLTPELRDAILKNGLPLASGLAAASLGIPSEASAQTAEYNNESRLDDIGAGEVLLLIGGGLTARKVWKSAVGPRARAFVAARRAAIASATNPNAVAPHVSVLTTPTDPGRVRLKAAPTDPVPGFVPPYARSWTGKKSDPAAVDPTSYYNFKKVVLDQEGTQRVQETLRAMVAEGELVKGKVTHKQTRELAEKFDLTPDALLAIAKQRGLSPAELHATNRAVATNEVMLSQIARDIDAAKIIGDDEAVTRLSTVFDAIDTQSRHLLRVFSTERTNAGRTLNSLKMVANATLDPATWFVRAIRLLGSQPLTAEMRATITSLAMAGDRTGLASYVAKLEHYNSWADIAGDYYKASLLYGLRTHEINAVGNTLFQGAEAAKDAPATVVDAVASRLIGAALSRATAGKVGGARTKAFSRSMLAASWKGAVEGIADAKAKAAGDLTDLDLYGRRWDQLSERTTGNKLADLYLKAPFRALEASDAFFKRIAFSRSLAEQAKVLGHQGPPTDDMVAQAITDAMFATFQNKTLLGSAAAGLKRAFANNAAGRLTGHLILPFTRTPAAVVTAAARYTPLGLASVAYDAGRVVKTLRAIRSSGTVTREQAGALRALQKAISENTGRVVVGAPLLAAGYYLASQGFMAPTPAKADRGEYDQLETEGRTPRSLAIHGYDVRVDRLGPVGMLLTLGADLHGLVQAPEATLPTVGAQFVSAYGAMTQDQTFLTSLTRVQRGFDNPLEQGKNVITGTLAGLTPFGGMSSQVARATDPLLRDTKTGTFGGDLAAAFKARIPGLSTTLPAKQDALGRPVRRVEGGLGASLLAEMGSPVPLTEHRTDSLTAGLRAADVAIPRVSRDRKAGETYDELRGRQAETGGLLRQVLPQVLGSPELREGAPGLTPDIRRNAIEGAAERVKRGVSHRANLRRAARQQGLIP